MQKILRKIALFVLLAILPVTFSGCIAFLDGDSYEDIFNSSKYDLEVQVQLTHANGRSYFASGGAVTIEYLIQKDQRTYDTFFWEGWSDPSEDAITFSVIIPLNASGSRTIVEDVPEGRYYLYVEDIKNVGGYYNSVKDEQGYFNLGADSYITRNIEFIY